MSEEKVVNLEDAKEEKVEEQQNGAAEQKPQFKTVDEALQYEIYKLYKQSKDDEEYDMCISDRFNSLDFVPAFKDAINSYRNDVIICDRLYHKRFCVEGTRPVHTMPEEATKLADEFVSFTQTIDWKSQDAEYMENVQKKIADYQEKLKAPEMQPQLKDVATWLYKNEMLDKEYLVMPVSDIPDQALLNISGVIAKFVTAYFLTMRFVLNGKFRIKVFPVHSGDYIDIVAQIEIA
jgi:hypothetical protein